MIGKLKSVKATCTLEDVIKRIEHIDDLVLKLNEERTILITAKYEMQEGLNE